jgi:hypothetical protein
MEEYKKPLPVITPEDKPFWDAGKRHELMLQKCGDCDTLRHPSPICGNCLSMDSEWVAMSGRGKLYTWTVVHQRYHPGFAEETPYNVAIVELEEGPRLLTKIVDCPNDNLYIGMEVEVVFEDVTEEIALPKFKPV